MQHEFERARSEPRSCLPEREDYDDTRDQRRVVLEPAESFDVDLRPQALTARRKTATDGRDLLRTMS